VALRIDIVTIFPEMVKALLQDGVVARACESGIVDLAVHDLRDFTTDRHRVVDDTPFGGGPGMVMKPEPFFRAVRHIVATRGGGTGATPSKVILPTPQGRRFTHDVAVALSREPHLVLLCGRYEGVDERVAEALVTDEISIGDYVLSGGELAAMVIIDAVARQAPGVVGDAQSVAEDSFSHRRLDHPHYTRPAEFEGWRAPDVLLSGHHAEIARWRLKESLRRTLTRRPDLLDPSAMDEGERAALDEVQGERERREQEP
jgi:tRNA (guanine37-N1)-methyltransferase